MLMPPFNNKLSMGDCKLLSPRQLSDLQSLRFAQLNSMLHLEHRFPATVLNVDVKGPVIVTVEKESVFGMAVSWHGHETQAITFFVERPKLIHMHSHAFTSYSPV
jgi:hypothetical protein